MKTEAMIRELRRLAEKHKNDRVDTCDTNWSALCTDVADRLEELSKGSLWDKLCGVFREEPVELIITDKFGIQYNMSFPNKQRAVGYATALQDREEIIRYRITTFKW